MGAGRPHIALLACVYALVGIAIRPERADLLATDSDEAKAKAEADKTAEADKKKKADADTKKEAKNPKCDTTSCASGSHFKANHATITCAAAQCDPTPGGECCQAHPKCDTTSCASGSHFKADPATITCAAAQCDPTPGGECCQAHDIHEIVASGGCSSVELTVLGEQECQTYAEGLGANQWHGFQEWVNCPLGCFRDTEETPSKVFFNRDSRVKGSEEYPVICKGKLLEIGNFKRVKSTTDGCREHKGFTELVRAECETWAHKEKLPLREDNQPSYPRGCYTYRNIPKIYFNTHSIGNHDSSTTLICKPEKQAASPPKPDRHGSNCGAACDWKGKWWKAKGGVCDWCGIHKGKNMACCKSGNKFSDPGCGGTDSPHGWFHSCRMVAGSVKTSADEPAEEPSGSGSSRPLLTFVSVVVVSFILGFT